MKREPYQTVYIPTGTEDNPTYGWQEDYSVIFNLKATRPLSKEDLQVIQGLYTDRVHFYVLQIGEIG